MPGPDFHAIARTLRVIADANRLVLLDRLGPDELTVTQIAERIGQTFQQASKQLRALWSERLVHRRRSGSHVLYRRAGSPTGEVVDLLLAWVHRNSRAV